MSGGWAAKVAKFWRGGRKSAKKEFVLKGDENIIRQSSAQGRRRSLGGSLVEGGGGTLGTVHL